jgi:inorganic pyrophosphatase
MEFDVVVEIPANEKNKYEIDHETGNIYLDRTLFTATHYPADYGFIDDTLGQDGDPLDALVLLISPTFPGCRIVARPVAMLQMTDEKGPDDKVICVPADDPRYEKFQDLNDIDEFEKQKIQHFFEVYKALEPGKKVLGIAWSDKSTAQDEVNASRTRFQTQHKS